MRLFKRLGALALVGTILLMTGCSQVKGAAIQLGMAESPYYHLGDTEWEHGGVEEYYFNQIPSEFNEIYRELYSRLSNYEDSGDLYAQVDVEDFWDIYYAVLADHPEFFWIGTNIEVKQASLTGKAVGYSIETTVPKEERDSMKAQLEEAADACIAKIPEGSSDYGKIKSVYEYIINKVEYDTDAPQNQNIQSVLLGDASVCAGYSKAFQYILHRMGMFCTYITGRIEGGGDHGWNVVRIDGNYYNVDVTWGDPVFAGSEEDREDNVTNYNYLCCTDSDLLKTHIPDISVPVPVCDVDGYNYYKWNGMYYDTFDRDTIHEALMNSVWNGENHITMKFGSWEGYESAKYELFENGLIQDPAQYLMSVNGASTWNYRYNVDDDFNLITIYW